MAKGSVRKKGKKWYYRFYIEDESGNRVQKEFPGTESIFFCRGQALFFNQYFPCNNVTAFFDEFCSPLWYTSCSIFLLKSKKSRACSTQTLPLTFFFLYCRYSSTSLS